MDRELNAGGKLLDLWDDLIMDSAFPVWFDWPVVEAEAVMLRSFEPMLVYGLLQTETYARTVLFGDEESTAARLTRRKIPQRSSPPPPSLVCLLDEATLYKEVGGPEVKREQLEHLLALISPRLSIHIVPKSAIHPGNAGGFVIATLDARSEVAYVTLQKWRKSSYTASNGGHCVEVARLAQGIGVRDSKKLEHGHLSLIPVQFAALLTRLKRHPRPPDRPFGLPPVPSSATRPPSRPAARQGPPSRCQDTVMSGTVPACRALLSSAPPSPPPG